VGHPVHPRSYGEDIHGLVLNRRTALRAWQEGWRGHGLGYTAQAEQCGGDASALVGFCDTSPLQAFDIVVHVPRVNLADPDLSAWAPSAPTRRPTADARLDALSCGRIVGRGGLVATLRCRSVSPGGTAKLAREAAGAAASAVDAVAAVAAVAECRLDEFAIQG
jgi:hypothetical protein